MSREGISPRIPVAIGVLALVPLAVYGLTHSVEAAGIAAVNVALIVAALFLAMGPIESVGAEHS